MPKCKTCQQNVTAGQRHTCIHPRLSRFLGRVWRELPQMAGDKFSLEDRIYNIYSPLPPAGVSERWTFWHSPREGEHPTEITERVYLSAKPDQLIYVWKTVKSCVFQTTKGVIQAKRTTVEAAATRPDTIVIYCQDRGTVRRVMAALQNLHQGRPGTSARPPVPPRLREACFKDETPPVTLPAKGMRGIAWGSEPQMLASSCPIRWGLDGTPEDEQGGVPLEQCSFGGRLSRLVAWAWQARRTRAPGEFVRLVIEQMLAHGINPKFPWTAVASPVSLNLMEASGRAAQARRLNRRKRVVLSKSDEGDS